MKHLHLHSTYVDRCSSCVQFASWVDAVILVFSLENEASFEEVYKIYHQLSLHRPVSEIPFIVVGTQGESLKRKAAGASMPHVFLQVDVWRICDFCTFSFF